MKIAISVIEPVYFLYLFCLKIYRSFQDVFEPVQKNEMLF